MKNKTYWIILNIIAIVFNILASFMTFMDGERILCTLNSISASICACYILGLIYKDDMFYIFKEIKSIFTNKN